MIPFALIVFLLCILFSLSVINGSGAERIVLAVIFVLVLSLFCEAAARRVVASESHLRVRKFLRERELLWEDITHVGALVIRRKVYILLTTKKGLHILSNFYGDFPLLVRDIAGHVGMEKVEKIAGEQIENPVINNAPIVSTWVATVIITFIVAGRLFLF